MTALASVLMAGAALMGCASIKEATGATKQPPDEFTVLTKSPLVIPPDYNLRPPQPGIASRNELDPDAEAQTALFPASGTTMLGDNYSDGEKLLLSKTDALGVDPNIRRSINSDIGQEDQGPEFTAKVLYQGPMPAPAAAPDAAMPGAAAPQPAMDKPADPPKAEEKGFFGRVFGPRSEAVPANAKRIQLAANTSSDTLSDIPRIQLAADTSSDDSYLDRLFTRKRQPDRAPKPAETEAPASIAAPAPAPAAGASAPAAPAATSAAAAPAAAPAVVQQPVRNGAPSGMRKREARNLYEYFTGLRQGTGDYYEPIPAPAPPPPPRVVAVAPPPPPKPEGPPEARNLYELVTGKRSGITETSASSAKPEATPAVQKTPENPPEEKKGWFARNLGL